MTGSEGMRWRLWKLDMSWKVKTGYTRCREKKDEDSARRELRAEEYARELDDSQL